MNIAAELKEKLTSAQYEMVASQVEKASKFFDDGFLEETRKALKKAVKIAKARGEYSAAQKIEYYLRFC